MKRTMEPAESENIAVVAAGGTPGWRFGCDNRRIRWWRGNFRRGYHCGVQCRFLNSNCLQATCSPRRNNRCFPSWWASGAKIEPRIGDQRITSHYSAKCTEPTPPKSEHTLRRPGPHRPAASTPPGYWCTKLLFNRDNGPVFTFEIDPLDHEIIRRHGGPATPAHGRRYRTIHRPPEGIELRGIKRSGKRSCPAACWKELSPADEMRSDRDQRGSRVDPFDACWL